MKPIYSTVLMFSMLVTICGGCSRAYKDPYIHDFYSSDARVQRQLIKELAHSQIEHTINDDGTITFKKKDKPEVDALLDKIEEKSYHRRRHKQMERNIWGQSKNRILSASFFHS